MPALTPRFLVGHGAGPGSAAGDGGATGLPAATLAAAAGVAVTVTALAGAAAGLAAPPPQAASRIAVQAGAVAATAHRAMRRAEVIVPFAPGPVLVPRAGQAPELGRVPGLNGWHRHNGRRCHS